MSAMSTTLGTGEHTLAATSARVVWCPECDAWPEQPCVSRTGRPVEFHALRKANLNHERLPDDLPVGPGVTMREMAWQDYAACQYTDPDLFYPELGGMAENARRVCAECPVRDPCLDYAMRHRETDGVWGGYTPDERKHLRTAALAA